MSLTTKEPKEEKKAKVKYAKVIKLTKPLKDLDETITELKFVEMTLDDIMDYSITDLQKKKGDSFSYGKFNGKSCGSN